MKTRVGSLEETGSLNCGDNMIFVAIGLLLILCSQCFVLSRKHKKLEEKEPTFVNQFSISEYYTRLEKLHEEFLLDRERKRDSEEYAIILWWGFDGLRVNKDGTSTWISKKPKESDKPVGNPLINSFCNVGRVPTYYPYGYQQYFPSYNIYFNPISYYSTQIQQCCCTMDYINSLQAQCMQSTQSRIYELQERNRNLELQIAHSEHMRNLLQEIQVPEPVLRTRYD